MPTMRAARSFCGRLLSTTRIFVPSSCEHTECSTGHSNQIESKQTLRALEEGANDGILGGIGLGRMHRVVIDLASKAAP